LDAGALTVVAGVVRASVVLLAFVACDFDGFRAPDYSDRAVVEIHLNLSPKAFLLGFLEHHDNLVHGVIPPVSSCSSETCFGQAATGNSSSINSSSLPSNSGGVTRHAGSPISSSAGSSGSGLCDRLFSWRARLWIISGLPRNSSSGYNFSVISRVRSGVQINFANAKSPKRRHSCAFSLPIASVRPVLFIRPLALEPHHFREWENWLASRQLERGHLACSQFFHKKLQSNKTKAALASGEETNAATFFARRASHTTCRVSRVTKPRILLLL
jgi:hypothetical protein